MIPFRLAALVLSLGAAATAPAGPLAVLRVAERANVNGEDAIQALLRED